MGAHLDTYTKAIECTFLMRKRGIYYFRRSVPVDLTQYFKQQRIVVSLRTRDLRVAKARATQMSLKLQHEFDHLRWRDTPQTFAKVIAVASDVSHASTAPTLSEACELYAAMKGKGKPKTFHQSLQRAVRYLTLACADKPIDTYDRADVNHFRDQLLDRGLSTNSVSKTISIIRAMLNFVCREHDLDPIQSFTGVFIEEEGPQKKRASIPVEVIRAVQAECYSLDDEARWLIGLISDTGMRLSEALGLSTADIILDEEHPYVWVREHSWRRLKTRSSQRKIPLVGASLWAARRALQETSTDRLFPKYCAEEVTKSNSASGALNKWLRPRLPDGAVIHSFRHAIRDRLRAVECPPEIADAIGGWSRAGIGEKYGEGYAVAGLRQWLALLE